MNRRGFIRGAAGALLAAFYGPSIAKAAAPAVDAADVTWTPALASGGIVTPGAGPPLGNFAEGCSGAIVFASTNFKGGKGLVEEIRREQGRLASDELSLARLARRPPRRLT